MKKSSPKILVAPLDWGLGHATRCIPIVRHLLELNAEVLLAASGRAKTLLKGYFPELTTIDFPDYGVTHPVHGSFAIHLARKSGSVFKKIRQENRELKQLVKEHQIDAVISDNRYGLHHPDIPCVFITHQMNIRAPWPLRSWLKRIMKGFILKFDVCWVPDFEDEPNLSGELSHGKDVPFNVRYIGALSRFSKTAPSSEKENNKLDILALISGPEPQRSYFEKLVFRQMSVVPGNHLLVCGRPGEKADEGNDYVKVVDHLADDELQQAILTAKHIICRPGYSTLMDLYFLGKGALLVPTPGQTEQEYLAKRWSEYCQVQDQKNLDLRNLNINKPFPKQDEVDLKAVIGEWLKNLI